MLAACFVLTSLNVANAALPFTPSTNTTDGAVWYRMFNATAAANGLSSYLKAADYGEQLVMADAAASDDFLFCLVGDETAGFQIYNKALLDDGTKLTSVFLNWFNPIIATTAANAADWDAGGYTWTFDTDGSLMAMYSGTRYFFRFPSDMKQVLTCTYGGGDAIWTFEPSDTPIQTDRKSVV